MNLPASRVFWWVIRRRLLRLLEKGRHSRCPQEGGCNVKAPLRLAVQGDDRPYCKAMVKVSNAER